MNIYKDIKSIISDILCNIQPDQFEPLRSGSMARLLRIVPEVDSSIWQAQFLQEIRPRGGRSVPRPARS